MDYYSEDTEKHHKQNPDHQYQNQNQQQRQTQLQKELQRKKEQLISKSKSISVYPSSSSFSFDDNSLKFHSCLDHYTNIVFTGAAIRGVGYGGFWKAWCKLGRAPYISHVAGSSSGAMFALSLVLGFTPKQMSKYLTEIYWAKVFGVDKHRFTWHLFFKWYRIGKKLGILPLDNLKTQLEWMLEKKGFSKNILMGELYEALCQKYIRMKNDTQRHYNKLSFRPRHLYLNAVDVSKSDLVRFSTLNSETEEIKNTPVVNAVLYSMSLPIIFQPICDKKTGATFLDAGLINSCNSYPFLHDRSHTLIVSMVNNHYIPKPRASFDFNTKQMYSGWKWLFYNIILCLRKSINHSSEHEEFDHFIIPLNNADMYDSPLNEKRRMFELAYKITLYTHDSS